MRYLLKLTSPNGCVRHWCFESVHLTRAKQRAAELGRPAESFLGICLWELFSVSHAGKLTRVSWRIGSGADVAWNPNNRVKRKEK